MVPSSPSCGSDSGLTSDHDTIGPVSSPYQTFKLEEDSIPVTNSMTSCFSSTTMTHSINSKRQQPWDTYESLDDLHDLFSNNENTNHVANSHQVKIENTGEDHHDQDFPPLNSNILMEDINELLSMNAGISSGFVDTHDDSSTDLFPDLGDVGMGIDPLIACSY